MAECSLNVTVPVSWSKQAAGSNSCTFSTLTFTVSVYTKSSSTPITCAEIPWSSISVLDSSLICIGIVRGLDPLPLKSMMNLGKPGTELSCTVKFQLSIYNIDYKWKCLKKHPNKKLSSELQEMLPDSMVELSPWLPTMPVHSIIKNPDPTNSLLVNLDGQDTEEHRIIVDLSYPRDKCKWRKKQRVLSRSVFKI